MNSYPNRTIFYRGRVSVSRKFSLNARGNEINLAERVVGVSATMFELRVGEDTAKRITLNYPEHTSGHRSILMGDASEGLCATTAVLVFLPAAARAGLVASNFFLGDHRFGWVQQSVQVVDILRLVRL